MEFEVFSKIYSNWFWINCSIKSIYDNFAVWQKMNKSIKRNSESKKAIRRKSPVPARQKKDSFSVKNTTNETSLTNENFERENSLAIESKTNGICDEISASTLTIRLTHSESFTFDNLDQYKKSIVRKDYLEVPYADEEENFHDAIAYFDQEQQYDLPSDPVSRNRWLDRLKSYNDRGTLNF